jgi:hypothetical protein
MYKGGFHKLNNNLTKDKEKENNKITKCTKSNQGVGNRYQFEMLFLSTNKSF